MGCLENGTTTLLTSPKCFLNPSFCFMPYPRKKRFTTSDDECGKLSKYIQKLDPSDLSSITKEVLTSYQPILSPAIMQMQRYGGASFREQTSGRGTFYYHRFRLLEVHIGTGYGSLNFLRR